MSCPSRRKIMRTILTCLIAPVAVFAATTAPLPLTTVSTLEREAQQRVSAKARVPLVDQTSALFSGVDSLEPVGRGQVPNYLRAIAVLPKMPGPLSRLFKTFISNGALPSETKLAMALRIAQVNHSPYTAAHVERLLRSTERGNVILAALKSNQTATLSLPEQRALAYAEESSKHVDGLSDADFQSARAFYNDSQVVELAFTSCFFNYFTRFSEALNLPVESWALETMPAPLKALTPEPARVSLVSD